MSCIAGIINLDGAPVDRALLARMTDTMKNRAPDESNVWVSGNVGFGHAMLRISPESEDEHQPCTLDGQVWITADARIDGQAELIRQLRSAGQQVRISAPDVELILHAYSAFGESFLDYLIGDFAFALWDERNKKLICARDHFGVRPFFYVKSGRFLAFASDIVALLKHPAVSGRLDEVAVGDFLLFGCYGDAELSIYMDIRRLPAASYIRVGQAEIRIQPYWRLSPPEIKYGHSSEYLEQFQELFHQAVNDRVRTKNIAAELSGGMDSTSIAAVVAANMSNSGGMLTGYTTVCNSLLPEDKEGYYAGLVASHLKIPAVCRSIADYALFERHENCELATAEPTANPHVAFTYDAFKLMTNSGARVLLSGFAGDAVLAGGSTYYEKLLYRGHIVRLMVELYRHWRNAGSLRGLGLRGMLLPVKNPPDWPFPGWLNNDFVKTHQLEERWRHLWQIYRRSDTSDQLTRPWAGFGAMGYEALQMPLEARFPFMDIRLVMFLMGAANYIKHDKLILRKAMFSKLPEPVRTRPKEGLTGDLVREKIAKGKLNASIDLSSDLAEYGFIDMMKYRQAFEAYMGGDGSHSTFSSDFIIQPLALSAWLKNHAF